MSCDKQIYKQAIFCHDCFQKIQFISNGCKHCGQPLLINYDNLQNRICVPCSQNRELQWLDDVRSLFIYSHKGREIILQIKRLDKQYLYKTLASLFYESNKGFFLNSDFIIPIPIHWTARLIRGFDQSFLIAEELSSISRIQLRKNILIKKRKTEKQSLQLYENRFNNIRGSFLIKNNDIINNKNIILVDDVATTGATAIECSKLLKASGAKSIKLFTLAKTILTHKYDNF